jgi:hypothetical protein
MDSQLYIMVFEHYGNTGRCNETEIRICSAISMEKATEIAKKYRDKYYHMWNFHVRDVVWNTDDSTAYIGSYYS